MTRSAGRPARAGGVAAWTIVLAVVMLLAAPPATQRPASPASAAPLSAAAPVAPLPPVESSLGSHTPAGFAPLTLAPGGPRPTIPPPTNGILSPVSPRASLPRTPVGPWPLTSDPSNAYLDNYSATTAVAQVGPSNQSVVVGATDGSSLVPGAGCIWNDGLSAAFRTNDGGQTWSTAWLPQNANWLSTSSWSCGDISAGEPSLAGGANGTVLYASTYAQPCAYFGFPILNCNSARNYTAPAGVAVARSTTSGVSWTAPVPVDNMSWYKWFEIVCGGVTYAGALPANLSDKPSVAYSSVGRVAVVSWDVLSYVLSISCQAGVGVYTVDSLTEFTDVSVSTDNGVSWSAARTIGRLAAGVPAVAVGPAPGFALSVVYADYVNATVSTFSLAYSQSTDRGAHWSAPADIGAITLVHPSNGTSADALKFPTLPSYAVDNWSDSSFRGTSYVVWGDNRTSAAHGLPSVDLVRSAAGGGSWSGVTVLAAATPSLQYFEPTVTVGPGGRVWVVYYELDTLVGGYQLFGEYSDDGGSHWTVPFAVSDVPGYPGPTITSIGSWVGAAATSAGLYSAWADCRWSGCFASGITAAYAAHTEPVTVFSPLSNVVATATSDGGYVSSTVPLATAWDLGAPVSLTVSPWVTLSNTTDWVGVFSNLSGAVTSTSNSAFFDYGGGSVTTANYAISPAGWISGTIGPASAHPSVLLGGVSVPLGPWNATALAFNATIDPGLVYSFAASATDYATFSTNLPTAAFRATPISVSLSRTDGWIRGQLLPATATLRVNGTVVTTVNPATGLFNVSVGWGSYWVNASGTGLSSASRYLVVAPGTPSVVDFSLVGGWIEGTVSPGSATVRVDGVTATVTGGTFNVTVLGGSHTVSATAPGYASFRSSVVVVPTRGAEFAIALTDTGTIRGSVSPVTASVVVGGNLVAVIGGVFDVGVLGGATYNVTVSAPGYLDASKNLVVTPANVTYANFTLSSVPACVSSCGGTNPTGSPSGSASLPYSWLDVAIAAAVILGAALVVALLLLRTPGSRAEDAPPEPESPPPDEEIYGSEESTSPWNEDTPPADGGGPPS